MTVTTLPRQASARIVGLDVARGAAILLMVLDHVLYQAAPGHVLRLTVTRLALPIFCVVAGALWRPGWRSRYLELGAAWLLAEILVRLLGMPTPDVLLPIAVGFGVLQLADRSPWLVLVALLVLDHVALGSIPGWSGYSPWYVAALMVVGHLARAEVVTAADRSFSRSGSTALFFASVGRAPLRWYVGHLLVLVVATNLASTKPDVMLAPGPAGYIAGGTTSTVFALGTSSVSPAALPQTQTQEQSATPELGTPGPLMRGEPLTSRPSRWSQE